MIIPETPAVIESLSQFNMRIDHAKMNRDEWLETTPEIIKYFNRRGLGGSDFYIHEGIKVCEYGMKDKILEKEQIQMDKRLHGDGEGTLEGV